jgi:hypothetical protein
MRRCTSRHFITPRISTRACGPATTTAAATNVDVKVVTVASKLFKGHHPVNLSSRPSNTQGRTSKLTSVKLHTFVTGLDLPTLHQAGEAPGRGERQHERQWLAHALCHAVELSVKGALTLATSSSVKPRSDSVSGSPPLSASLRSTDTLPRSTSASSTA